MKKSLAINCATFVGYKQKGVAGAVAATLGVVTPSFVIIYLISKFLGNFLEIQGIVSGFKGIRIAVGILILDAAIGMIKKMKKKTIPCIILGISFVIMLLNNIFNRTDNSTCNDLFWIQKDIQKENVTFCPHTDSCIHRYSDLWYLDLLYN